MRGILFGGEEMNGKMTDYEKKELVLMIVKLVLIIAAIAVLIWVNAYFAFLILAIFIWIGIDVALGLSKKARPVNPPKDQKHPETKFTISDILWLLENPTLKNPEIDFTLDDLTEEEVKAVLEPYVDYIEKRYDCCDFLPFTALCGFG